ncbi:hypothetical protein LCGC14_0221070 [marine sediment metagenome]|uniref:Uncharacterized protein n=1 Tax=marine sediment metagenome TaxID=412755 RepID=A0A0F9UHT9_9ZZZZ
MLPEDAKKNKCDRCGVIVSLYRHANGWRCPSCIWNERENLIKWSKPLLNLTHYTAAKYKDNPVVIVSRRNLDALAEVVKEVTSI